jgi:hypothetical protein
MFRNRKFQLKHLMVFSLVFVLMGNSGCETEEERRSGRHLKRSASFLGISASTIRVNNSIEIDLKGLLNRQFTEAVNNSDFFTSADRFRPQSFSDKRRQMARTFNANFSPLAPNRTSAVCTKDLPDILLAGSATDFEMTLSGGISIGLGGVTGGVVTGANVNVERMVMSLDMHAYEPLTFTDFGASVSRKGIKTDFSGGLGLNLFGLILNPTINVPQQFATVTKSTLRTTLNSLGQRIEELEFAEAIDPWGARVYAENDSHILINAGMKHGLKVGDYLWVSNMDYTWEGNQIPCESPLRFQRRRHTFDNPLAIVQVESLGLDSASAKVVRETQFVDIEEGAKAFVFKLLEEESD